MAVSKVDICNKAIKILGGKPIASMTEQSNNAITLNQIFPTVRDSVLRAHDWGFARIIESLAQLSGETIPGWTYLYAVPAICVAIRKVFTDVSVTNPDPTEYLDCRSPTSSQHAIACNDSPAYIHYTSQTDDPSLYSADFVLAFALALAAESAYSLTGNIDLGTALAAKYGAAISEAKRTDSLSKSLDPTADQSSSTYEDSRA